MDEIAAGRVAIAVVGKSLCCVSCVEGGKREEGGKERGRGGRQWRI